VPAEFEEVPLRMDFEAAWAEVSARSTCGSATAERDEQSQVQMARALQRISRFLDEGRVVYAANCLRSFEGEISLGSLAVAIVDYPYGDDAATAARGSLRGVLASRGEGWTGAVVDAPCGKAAVFTGGQSYVLPPSFSPTGEELDVLTAQFHALVPVPSEAGDGQRILLHSPDHPLGKVLRADHGRGTAKPPLHPGPTERRGQRRHPTDEVSRLFRATVPLVKCATDVEEGRPGEARRGTERQA
ncbi:hypothetical protein ACFVJ9_57010, partial [Streptomyces sp. NPDC127574]